MTWILLSHTLAEDTPLYGGQERVKITRTRAIAEGDSSNNSVLYLPAHAGTHVDAPRHFDPEGATLESYSAGHWQAVAPFLLDVPSRPGDILDLARLGVTLEAVPPECDLLLLRTGAEAWRSERPRVYSEEGPGVGPDVCNWLRVHRRLKFLGLDFVSLSSFAHREVGGRAHRALLAPNESGTPPIVPVEDMALSRLERSPEAAWIVPLCFTEADGGPATVLARV